jgi:hypothetical protein
MNRGTSASGGFSRRSQRGKGRKGDFEKELIALLDEAAFDEIGRRSAGDKNVIKYLIAASYDKDNVRTWRAIEAMVMSHGMRGWMWCVKQPASCSGP